LPNRPRQLQPCRQRSNRHTLKPSGFSHSNWTTDQGQASTKQESLHLAKEFIEEWYLTRRGKSRQGDLISETPVKQAAAVFEPEHEIVTEVQYSPRLVEGH
jgi:hypothetical protein